MDQKAYASNFLHPEWTLFSVTKMNQVSNLFIRKLKIRLLKESFPIF